MLSDKDWNTTFKFWDIVNRTWADHEQVALDLLGDDD